MQIKVTQLSRWLTLPPAASLVLHLFINPAVACVIVDGHDHSDKCDISIT
jgi:hypothetical protein